MSHITITTDLESDWRDVPPIYRLWVDDLLLSERDYWPNAASHHIQEVSHVMLAPGEHKIWLELVYSKSTGQVWFKHIVIKQTDGHSHDVHTAKGDMSFTFKVV